MPVLSLAERVERYNKLGAIAGKFFIVVAMVDLLLYWFLEWWAPRKVGLKQATEGRSQSAQYPLDKSGGPEV